MLHVCVPKYMGTRRISVFRLFVDDTCVVSLTFSRILNK